MIRLRCSCTIPKYFFTWYTNVFIFRMTSLKFKLFLSPCTQTILSKKNEWTWGGPKRKASESKLLVNLSKIYIYFWINDKFLNDNICCCFLRSHFLRVKGLPIFLTKSLSNIFIFFSIFFKLIHSSVHFLHTQIYIKKDIIAPLHT